MLNDINLTLLVATALTATGCYLIVRSNKKLLPSPSKHPKATAEPVLSFSRPAGPGLPNLIDRPGFDDSDDMTMTIDRQPYSEPILELEEDEDTHLLKAAEMVVEKVQDVVDHIASNPPSPEEVFTKIKAVINPYTIFHNTDYFDAINSFIAVTVERDCGIRFTKEDLLNLWN